MFPRNETKIDFRAVLLRVALPFGNAIASKLNEFNKSFLSESQTDTEKMKSVTEDVLQALETSMKSALPILLKDKEQSLFESYFKLDQSRLNQTISLIKKSSKQGNKRNNESEQSMSSMSKSVIPM